MRQGMTHDELKRFEALERLVHKQTDKILQMREEIEVLRDKLKLKGRSRFIDTGQVKDEPFLIASPRK